MKKRLIVGVLVAGMAVVSHGRSDQGDPSQQLYTYTISHDGTPDSYDEAVAVACLQGILNRTAPNLYVLSRKDAQPAHWQAVLSDDDRWLHGKRFEPLPDLTALVRLTGDRLRGAVIWDPEVPATLNVATTIAGVEDGVVLSPALAAARLGAWNLPVLIDLRGQFDGRETGSRKNDAYRWAVNEYLRRGRCSASLLCLYEDAFFARARGDLGYVVTRDWAVQRRAFVFDLSPWGDERPQDDPDQPLGTDLATYRMILEAARAQSAGQHMTELAGFFAFAKYSNVPGHASAHDPVPTEWETVWLISPYNCYQNTVASDCYNQSFHSQFPWAPLKQRRPTRLEPLTDKAYVCILMADYDSTTPLYQFLPNHWKDPRRGEIPLAWGINPNVIETYPDIVSYLYETATDNDYFTSDASAAGYMNPNRVEVQDLPLFVEHNRRFFRETDMTIAPMVLDWDQPTPHVKDAFVQFAPDGFATIVMDLHGTGGRHPEPHVWKGMPVLTLINSVCNFPGPEPAAEIMYQSLKTKPDGAPGFYFFRVVWVGPTQILQTFDVLRQVHPDLDWEVVDPYTFFRLAKEHYELDGTD